MAVRRAAAFGCLEVVQYLCSLPVDRGVKPGANMEVVQYLCSLPADRRVDPGARNNGLRYAAESGEVHVVKYLCSLPLDRGVDPGAHQSEALRSAAENGLISSGTLGSSLLSSTCFSGSRPSTVVRWTDGST